MARDENRVRFREIRHYDARDMCARQSKLPAATSKAIRHTASSGFILLTLCDGALHRSACSASARTPPFPQDKRQLVYWRFGHVHRERGSHFVAERCYRRAVDAAPADATYHIFLGALLAHAGRSEEAEAVHRRATGCKVGCIDEAFLNLGLVLRPRERYAEARECFQRALALDPKYKEARRKLEDVESVLQITRHA